ncbi:VOC family protein [Phycicoccus endophyticus]|nr:VOC family protein [Phycicoccus endophyticus]GGL35233.1 hypothetical protein GCM10012283_17070 [Phycicoccus endophyticus]
MHRSRIGVVLLDHPASTYEAAAAFWAAATGSERSPGGGPPEADPYEPLEAMGGGVHLELQRTGPGTPPRVHVDIETDDVEAEVARLTALGARVTRQHAGWVVLADPGGMPFCVVPVQTGAAFEGQARTWG